VKTKAQPSCNIWVLVVTFGFCFREMIAYRPENSDIHGYTLRDLHDNRGYSFTNTYSNSDLDALYELIAARRFLSLPRSTTRTIRVNSNEEDDEVIEVVDMADEERDEPSFSVYDSASSEEVDNNEDEDFDRAVALSLSLAESPESPESESPVSPVVTPATSPRLGRIAPIMATAAGGVVRRQELPFSSQQEVFAQLSACTSSIATVNSDLADMNAGAEELIKIQSRHALIKKAFLENLAAMNALTNSNYSAYIEIIKNNA